MIDLHKVSKIYPPQQVALSGVNLSISEGEFVCVAGASGAGKSTLLRVLFGSEVPSEGDSIVVGRNMSSLTQRNLPGFRRDVGFIFQDFNLLRAAALAGQGVALCPRSLIVDDLASGRLIQIFDTTVMKDRAYYMVEPAETQHRHSAALATVKAWLIAEATNAAT